MRDPQRFDFWVYQKVNEDGQLRARMEIEFSEHGRCVSWEDYASLKAEVERLRKAGNAMYDAAVQDSIGLWVMPAFEQWSKIKNETK